ncbi:hypothetical protein ACFXGA_24235 [Actinosynnema sp. NPDC059335]|uniref:hypothetical protein n=1 Tax=Actinosynnema sp. NPDC059335 TaxID=3346804 RepID=UPI003670F2D1
MSVLLCDARGDAIRRRHYIGTLPARQVDGFIVLGDDNDVRPSPTRDIPVPVVYVHCESSDPADLSVIADDEGGARLAVEHLVSLRRKHIGHITGPRTYRAAPRAGRVQRPPRESPTPTARESNAHRARVQRPPRESPTFTSREFNAER